MFDFFSEENIDETYGVNVQIEESDDEVSTDSSHWFTNYCLTVLPG